MPSRESFSSAKPFGENIVSLRDITFRLIPERKTEDSSGNTYKIYGFSKTENI